MNRKDAVDYHRREPLLTSKSGRVVETTIQRYVYTATRPATTTAVSVLSTGTPRSARQCRGTLHASVPGRSVPTPYVEAT